MLCCRDKDFFSCFEFFSLGFFSELGDFYGFSFDFDVVSYFVGVGAEEEGCSVDCFGCEVVFGVEAS